MIGLVVISGRDKRGGIKIFGMFNWAPSGRGELTGVEGGHGGGELVGDVVGE